MPAIKSIDVILCTYNSNKPYFERCLKSIKREIPLHHLIVIDKFSTDGTIAVVKRHFPDSVVIQSDASLAEARKIGINNVDTEQLMFVDDDIEIYEGWFSAITRNINNNVGAVQGMAYPVQAPKLAPYLSKWMLWSGKKIKKRIIDVDMNNLQKRIRGYTNNTIIQRDLIKDWVPPKNIYAYEDWLIQKHIVKKGYIWRIIRDLKVGHHIQMKDGVLGPSEDFKKVMWNSANARITGFTTGMMQVLSDNIKQCIKSFKASIDYSDPRILVYIFRLRINYTKAYLKWNKYKVLKRGK